MGEGGEVPEPGEPPLSGGEISWDRGEFQGLRGERSNQAGQSEPCVAGLCHSPAPPSLRFVCAGVDGGWVLEPGVWRVGTGRGLLSAAKRQPEGTKGRA